MGDQDPPPRQYRVSRGERNSIIPEDRISLGQKQILPLFPFTLSLPTFLPSTSQPPASSRTVLPPARPPARHWIPHLLYPPVFLTTPRFAPVAAAVAALAERMKAVGRAAAAQTRQIARTIFFLPANARSTSISSISRMFNSDVNWIVATVPYGARAIFLLANARLTSISSIFGMLNFTWIELCLMKVQQRRLLGAPW